MAILRLYYLLKETVLSSPKGRCILLQHAVPLEQLLLAAVGLCPEQENGLAEKKLPRGLSLLHTFVVKVAPLLFIACGKDLLAIGGERRGQGLGGAGRTSICGPGDGGGRASCCLGNKRDHWCCRRGRSGGCNSGGRGNRGRGRSGDRGRAQCRLGIASWRKEGSRA